MVTGVHWGVRILKQMLGDFVEISRKRVQTYIRASSHFLHDYVRAERFTSAHRWDGSEEAFTEWVGRHASIVYGAAFRQVQGNATAPS
jgi:hypothetical protein